MKCKYCDKEMELEEYSTDFLANSIICLREDFWCAHCGVTAVRNTWYTEESEEVEYGR